MFRRELLPDRLDLRVRSLAVRLQEGFESVLRGRGREGRHRSRLSGLEPTRGRRTHDDGTLLQRLDRRRTGEEHRRFQFLDDCAQLLDHGVRGHSRGLEHRLRHPRHRGAEGDPFRDVETASHAACGDEWQADVRQKNRCRRRDPPIPERGAEALFQAGGLFPRTVVLDRGERGAPEPADVDRAGAGRFEFLRRLTGDASPGLLRHQWELGGQHLDRREAALRAPIALWLDDLLQEIQVDDDRVRVDHVDRLACVGDADARKAIDMINADAIIIHLNFLQEVVQPEGDRRAKGCLAAIKMLASKFPLMAKETGAGISRETAQKLKAAGARAIDVGGLGGTSFSAVEHYRARKEAASLKERLGATFWNWGIPTPASILLADVGLPLVATGGVRSGLDVAKGIALGATMAGMAKPMLEAARASADAAVQELRAVIEELKAAMFLTGSTSIEALQERPVIVSPPTASWLEAGEA